MSAWLPLGPAGWIGLSLTVLVSVSVSVIAVRRAHRRKARLRTQILHEHLILLGFVSTGGLKRATLDLESSYMVRRVGRRRALGLLGREEVFSYRKPRFANRQRTVEGSWFYAVMYFIPRQIRSPWFDHLLEDRQRMAAEGRGHLFIGCATLVQCVSLVLHVVWERVLDILTPFKPRSQ